MNPYHNQNFWGFWLQFFFAPFREGPWASDEVQMGCLLFVAASTILVGFFLVFRKMTMVANSLSHTILLGVVAGYLLFRAVEGSGEPPLLWLMVAAFLTSIGTLGLISLLENRWGLGRDLANGYVFMTLFAIGVLAVSLFTKSIHLGVETVMGDIDMVGEGDLVLLMGVFGVDLLVIGLFFKELVLLSFDPELAKTSGLRLGFFRCIICVLTALTAVSAFRVAGIIMPLAFFAAPVTMARLFCHNVWSVLLWAQGVGIGVSLLAVSVSRHLLSEEGVAVATAGLAVALLFLFLIGHIGFFLARKR